MYIIEEEAIEAIENGNENLAFEIYMKLLTEEDFETDEDGKIDFELMGTQIFGNFRTGKRYFETYVSDDFTEEHRAILKDTLEDIANDLFDSAWDAWDMANHPNNY